MKNYQIDPMIAHYLFQYENRVNNLLSPGVSNAKTKKNGVETKIMYLSPYKQNSLGINICPMANNCINLCLNITGHGQRCTVQNARQAKTEFYLRNRELFCSHLLREIVNAYKKAIKQNKKIAIRLNGTSDIDTIGVIKKYTGVDVLQYATKLDSDIPGLLFYDYSKIPGKISKYVGTDYTLTFSYDNNPEEAKKALQSGTNVAVVFRNKLPKEFLGFPVIDGDKTDIEMLQFKGVVIGLTPKGKRAKEDTTGFVVDL